LDGSNLGAAGFPALLVGGALCSAGLVVGGRRVRRTQYRPDPWKWPEWTTVVAGLIPAAVLVGAGVAAVTGLNPSTQPLVWPTLPVVPALAIAMAALPAVLAPPPVRSADVDRGSSHRSSSASKQDAERPATTTTGRVEVPA
ncbi:MAG TPA: hypothetical protein VMB82_08420, partial [Acidimicrobiales bacterium]|nr:hypothetical protein [Acidimicrobiales bacterium]